jgi:hypothetical protein
MEKVKLSLCFFLTEHHNTKAYWGNEGIAPLILCSRQQIDVSGQLRAPAALPPGKEPLVPFG